MQYMSCTCRVQLDWRCSVLQRIVGVGTPVTRQVKVRFPPSWVVSVGGSILTSGTPAEKGKNNNISPILVKRILNFWIVVYDQLGNTLLEGVSIRLTWHMSWIWRRVYACLWLSLSVIRSIMTFFNANVTLFEMSLLWDLDINQYIITCRCLCHGNLILLRQHNLS